MDARVLFFPVHGPGKTQAGRVFSSVAMPNPQGDKTTLTSKRKCLELSVRMSGRVERESFGDSVNPWHDDGERRSHRHTVRVLWTARESSRLNPGQVLEQPIAHVCV
ncbi:hypothetical protein MN608_02065 [Microdochium nivale]|nr:hypothetical protein MN608_02065 [Microdochium nivale]